MGAVVVAIMVVSSAPASGAPARRTTKTWLTLSVAKGEEASPAVSRASLRCQPAGGSHPRARPACVELAKVNGDFAELDVVKDRACTMQYDPVTVAAKGFWRGTPVAYKRTFGNACAMSNATGPVFGM